MEVKFRWGGSGAECQVPEFTSYSLDVNQCATEGF